MHHVHVVVARSIKNVAVEHNKIREATNRLRKLVVSLSFLIFHVEYNIKK